MRIVILGAGITGLSAAWQLHKLFKNKVSLTVVEKSNRVGGWIRTDHINGFLFERGPRSIRPKGTGLCALELIKEVGLEEEILYSSPAAKKRFIWHQNVLECAPKSLWKAFNSPLTRDLLWTFLTEGLRQKKMDCDESIHAFISRRYSVEVTERLFDPLTACIYGGDIRTLSIRSCFPVLKEWEEQYGSLLRGALSKIFHRRPLPSLPGLVTLKTGMETLPQTLAKKIPASFLLNTTALNIHSYSSEIAIELSTGETLMADHVICTLPAHALAQLLLLPALQIPHASLTIVNVGWHHPVLRQEGFGCIFPQRAQSPLLGIVWDSSAFPGQNNSPQETRLTLMFGGIYGANLIHYPEDFFVKLSAEQLKTHLGIDEPPAVASVFKCVAAIPHYPVGYHATASAIKASINKTFPRLWLAGTAWEKVAIGACIADGKEVATQLALHKS